MSNSLILGRSRYGKTSLSKDLARDNRSGGSRILFFEASMDFILALRNMVNGAKQTRASWKPGETLEIKEVEGERVLIFTAAGQTEGEGWIPSQEAILANDWQML